MHWWWLQHVPQGLAQPVSVNVYQSGMNPGAPKENPASLNLLAVASWLQDVTHLCVLLLQSTCSGPGIRSLGTFPRPRWSHLPSCPPELHEQQVPQSPWENSPYISSPTYS